MVFRANIFLVFVARNVQGHTMVRKKRKTSIRVAHICRPACSVSTRGRAPVVHRIVVTGVAVFVRPSSRTSVCLRVRVHENVVRILDRTGVTTLSNAASVRAGYIARHYITVQRIRRAWRGVRDATLSVDLGLWLTTV